MHCDALSSSQTFYPFRAGLGGGRLMEDAIQSHRPRLTIGHWRLWLRRCMLHVPHARVAAMEWDWLD